MIEHLRGQELALEPLGWTGRETEWIALVCLHSGVFTQPQYADFYGIHRKASWRIVHTLVERKEAQVIRYFTPAEGGAVCWIRSKAIYRALGVENIRHRREVSRPLLIRRLLALDYVIEHPGLNWLPGEHEKVQFLTELGLDRSLVPRRIYFGAVGAQKRYFALKLPLALDPDAATFAYIDPGHATDNELRSWGAAHVRLWEALRKTGRRVRVIGIAAEHAHIERAERVLKVWGCHGPPEVPRGEDVAAGNPENRHGAGDRRREGAGRVRRVQRGVAEGCGTGKITPRAGVCSCLDRRVFYLQGHPVFSEERRRMKAP